MPTVRPRYQITETPDVAQALDIAARRWPHEPRSRLLVRLVRAGGASLAVDRDAGLAARRAAVDAASGKYDEVFDNDYLAKLRDDWPE